MLRQSQASHPDVYCIRVHGILGEHWSDYLGGMKISVHREHEPPETILLGPIADQAALMGVLTALYDLGFELVSVEHQAPE